MVIVCDSADVIARDQVELLMVDHFLKRCKLVDKQKLLNKDIKTFLKVASSIDVELSNGSELLKAFYLASRRVRGSDVPISAIDCMYVAMSLLYGF